MNLEKQPKPESDLVERRSGEINIVQPPHKPEPEKPSGKGMKTTVMAVVAVDRYHSICMDKRIV